MDAPPRRVLLIAYYVPPAGGPAVQRILQFTDHLPRAGWQPEVLTVRDGAFPNRDPQLLQRLAPSLPVHRTRAFDPLALYARLKGTEGGLPAGALDSDGGSFMERLARWVRANVFIPDARVGWWPFAVRRGRQLLRTGRFDAILTSGAPHSVHLIGHTLHACTGVPWVADLHDPWTDISYYDDFPHTRWARRLDASLERAVLRNATAVTTVSPSWADLFAQKVPGTYAVVENGFDAAAFAALEEPVARDTFVLAHVGKLYASRNPTVVWDALAALHADGAIPKLTLRCIGTVAPVVRQALAARNLLSLLDERSFIPHEEAIRAMARSALLLLAIEPFAQARGMITSKLYEYLASGRPVLGVGPANGDAAALLHTLHAGTMVDWDDVEAATAAIKAHYDAWAAGAPQAGAAWDAMQQHNRTAQAARMAAVLDGIVPVERTDSA